MRLLRLNEVRQRVPLSKQTIWRLQRASKFPKSYPIAGGRARGFLESEIDAYIASCVGTETPLAASSDRLAVR